MNGLGLQPAPGLVGESTGLEPDCLSLNVDSAMYKLWVLNISALALSSLQWELKWYPPHIIMRIKCIHIGKLLGTVSVPSRLSIRTMCVHAQLCLSLTPWTCQASVHGISQARILEWVAVSYSRGSSWPRDRTYISCTDRFILYHWATWEAHIWISCYELLLMCFGLIETIYYLKIVLCFFKVM